MHPTPFRASVLAAAVAVLGLMSASAAAAADAATPPAPATAQVDPARVPLASFDVAYVEWDLRVPGLATTQPDADLVEWKLPDIGRLVQERAPKVLAANGIAGAGLAVPQAASGTDLDIASIAPGRPLLLLRVASVTKTKPTLFSKAGSVVFKVQLLDRAAGTSAPVWQGGLGGTLGFDPVLGVLKTNRVDAAWVDRILLLALDQLAQKGLVKLPEAKATAPKD